MTMDTSEVDAEIQKIENQLNRHRLNKKLQIAALVVLFLVITGIVSGMIFYGIFGDGPEDTQEDAVVYGGGPSIILMGLFGALALGEQLYEQRDTLIQLRTNLGQLGSKKKDILGGNTRSRLGVLIRYKNDLPELVNGFRLTARKYSRAHNVLQVIVIGGSLSTSSLVAAFGATPWGRAAGIMGTLIVGASAAYSAYFKYKEKSLNLQRTADEIEREHRAVELRIGDYIGKSNEQALSEFVTKVEILRANQHRQQLELDQPADVQYRVAVAAGNDQ